MSQHKLLACLFPLIKYNWCGSFSRSNRCSRKDFSLKPSPGSPHHGSPQARPRLRREASAPLPAALSTALPGARQAAVPRQGSASLRHGGRTSTRKPRCKSQKSNQRKKGTATRPPPAHTYPEISLRTNRTIGSLSPAGPPSAPKKNVIRWSNH